MAVGHGKGTRALGLAFIATQRPWRVVDGREARGGTCRVYRVLRLGFWGHGLSV